MTRRSGKREKAISSTSDDRRKPEKSGAEAPPKAVGESGSSRKVLGLKKDNRHKKIMRNYRKMQRARRKDPYAGFRQYPTNKLADLDLIHKYIRQLKESDGFDVDVYPGLCFAAVYVPRPEFKEPCQLRTDAIEMSQLAVAQFNSDNRDSKGVPYEFQGIERVVSYSCNGEIFLITFQAREAETDDIKTFQAKVFDPPGLDEEEEREVMLVRLKEL
ncbi:uncharacterized protein LOC113760919 [Coffea eugenioides]|uniref:Uncharacterized protein LOC113732200 n=1 Tax=Coffea arabica TaxID=13443 RepID=A0A6P6WE12_COFAR|nr:uncharacterized protein LOC113732200 [Coffea arabica]XP_027159472.1 uncharacterized protein LOC113760919 [Coffea eugenioides]